ncbi:MAG TPA: hypothetical protein VFB06_31625, partial [Streptosporangiaceae bacterium]|nr:hypothetical protein [Streptosporangiaceae bacterium]
MEDMAIFQPRDDDAFIAWLDANPAGYVINTEQGGRGATYEAFANSRRELTRSSGLNCAIDTLGAGRYALSCSCCRYCAAT